ncbi:hypothetical protein B0H14DRAFT_2659182 [Mycena olivaceomarginata]|nr:hypothetical protein B0H14DRAFT_2659182 [Mycena olivaceomarginata]
MASDITKHRSHAEAQCHYQEKNLEATREKARERLRLAYWCECELAAKRDLGVLDVGHNADSDLHGRYEFRGGGNDEDHDQNTRKYWFIVFGVGLFTAQCVFFWGRWQGSEVCVVPRKDALQAAGNKDGVHVFITRNQATRVWARHCRRHHMTGCHKMRDPKAHSGDTDSNTDGNILTKRSKTPGSVKQEKKPVMHPSTMRAASLPVRRIAHTHAASHLPPTLPVKRVVHTPATTVPIKRAVEVAPPSTEKKRSLYADVKDDDADYSTDDDLFKLNSSADIPLTKSLTVSRTTSRALSTLHEDEDVPMPVAVAIPTPVSPTILSVSSLSATSAALLTFSSVSGPLRARSAARPSALSQHMLFNQKSLVLYDDAGSKTAVAERKVGESMEVVDAADVLSWFSTLGTSANMLYNRKTQILYDNVNAAIKERNPGESMQVVESEDVVEWISALAG